MFAQLLFMSNPEGNVDPVGAGAGADEEAAAATVANATTTICFMVALTVGSRFSSKTGVRGRVG